MADTPNVIGIASLSAKFQDLSVGMETRVARAMAVSGGRIIRDQAKVILRANGSVKTGATLRNIVIKREPRAPKGTAEYDIGVRHGKHLTKKQKAKSTLGVRGGRVVSKNADDPWYWFLVEYTGARPHSVARGANLSAKRHDKKHKNHPGFKAKPFLRPALDQKYKAAIDAMEARLDAELAKVNR